MKEIVQAAAITDAAPQETARCNAVIQKILQAEQLMLLHAAAQTANAKTVRALKIAVRTAAAKDAKIITAVIKETAQAEAAVKI